MPSLVSPEGDQGHADDVHPSEIPNERIPRQREREKERKTGRGVRERAIRNGAQSGKRRLCFTAARAGLEVKPRGRGELREEADPVGKPTGDECARARARAREKERRLQL